MYNMDDVIGDSDLRAPKAFKILRSTGTWASGGFQSVTSTIYTSGIVQKASEKEIVMIPEGDRAGGLMAFWLTKPMYVTRADKLPTLSKGETPSGATPGTVYTLSRSLTNGMGALYKNNLFLVPGTDYSVSGKTVTLVSATVYSDTLFWLYPEDCTIGAASDILEYNDERYRVMSVKHYPGSGFWRAIATRMRTT